MDPQFVAQQTGLIAGHDYDPDDIARAEKRLARLDVFRAMRIEAAGAIGNDGVLPFNVIVEEQAERRFGVGATYSTIDGLGIEGFHLWRNLFGRAERLRLDAKDAGINWPIATEEFDYAFGGTFTKPGFLNPDNDLVAAVSAERSVLPAYTETSASARVGLTQYLFDQLTLDGSAYYERSLFEDDFGTRNFSLVGLSGGLIWDARDNAQDATEGSPRREVVLRTQWNETNRRVRLVVQDSGTGFPEHILKRAFEPYVTTKDKGTGLGLAVVKKIADEHGARIDVKNRVQDGAIAGAQVSLSFAVAA